MEGMPCRINEKEEDTKIYGSAPDPLMKEDPEYGRSFMVHLTGAQGKLSPEPKANGSSRSGVPEKKRILRGGFRGESGTGGSKNWQPQPEAE